MVFPSQTYPILRVRKQSTETNDSRLQIFLTQETERQTLPFGKWFLNRKKKTKNYEKRKNSYTSATRHGTRDLSLGKVTFITLCFIRTGYYQVGKFSYIIRYSRLRCPQTLFFPSSVAHSHFDSCLCPL